MKRISLITIFFLSLCFSAVAQIQPINLGPTFDTPKQAFTKVNANDYYLDAKATASGVGIYTATVSPPIASYVLDQRFYITFTTANVGSSTLNLNGLGARIIFKNGNQQLSAGDIGTGQKLALVYDGTNFQILGGGGNLTASNGLTKTGNDIALGGAVTATKDITVTGTSANVLLRIQGSQTTNSPWGLNMADDVVGLTGAITITNGTSNLQALWSPTIASRRFVFTDGGATKKGIEYGAAGYETTDLSLTSRGYVLGSKTFTGTQTLRAGTATAGTAPLKFVSGIALTTPEDGALEYHTSHLYFTVGSTRYQLDQQGGITNTAAANEIMMSNGTNAVPSNVFMNGTSQLDLGHSTLAGSSRAISVVGSAASVGLLLQSKNDVNSEVEITAGATAKTRIQTHSFNVSTVGTPLKLRQRGTGTIAAGIGVGIEFETETDDGTTNYEVGSTIESVSTDITAGSEDFDLVVKTMDAGAAATEKLRLSTSVATVATPINITGNFALGNISNVARIDGAGAGSQIYRFLGSANTPLGIRIKEASIGSSYSFIDAPTNGAIIEGNMGIGVSTVGSKLDINQSSLGSSVIKYSSAAATDDPTVNIFQNRVLTGDATVTTIHTYAVPASTTVKLKAEIVARRTGGTAGTAEDGAGYEFVGTYKNVAGTATLIGSVTALYTAESQAAWDATFTVSAGNVLVQVTGALDNSITWLLSKFEVMPVSN